MIHRQGETNSDYKSYYCHFLPFSYFIL